MNNGFGMEDCLQLSYRLIQIKYSGRAACKEKGTSPYVSEMSVWESPF